MKTVVLVPIVKVWPDTTVIFRWHGTVHVALVFATIPIALRSDNTFYSS